MSCFYILLKRDNFWLNENNCLDIVYIFIQLNYEIYFYFRVLWQNYKTLWLPIIVSQHPHIIKHLLASSCGDHEWEARVTILRLSRSSGILDIRDHLEETFNESGHFSKINHSENLDDPSTMFPVHCAKFEISCASANFLENEINDKTIDIQCVLLNGLICVDDNIRAETFATLCMTQKTSLPLTNIEILLLKRFLFHNMNIDSQSFRQFIMRSFYSLVCRIRDSTYQEAKSFEATTKDLTSLQQSLSKETLRTFEFVIWLVNKFNEDLSSLGNYSRHSTALSLYWVLLNTFFDNSKFAKNKTERDRYLVICRLIHSLSTLISRDKSMVVNMNLTCSKTVNILLTCCVYEMNDVRQKACDMLKLLYKLDGELGMASQNGDTVTLHKGKELESWQDWLRLAVNLMDSPKTSEMESGVTLFKILLDTNEDLSDFVQLIFKVFMSIFYYDNLVKMNLIFMVTSQAVKLSNAITLCMLCI